MQASQLGTGCAAYTWPGQAQNQVHGNCLTCANMHAGAACSYGTKAGVQTYAASMKGAVTILYSLLDRYQARYLSLRCFYVFDCLQGHSVEHGVLLQRAALQA